MDNFQRNNYIVEFISCIYIFYRIPLCFNYITYSMQALLV